MRPEKKCSFPLGLGLDYLTVWMWWCVCIQWC